MGKLYLRAQYTNNLGAAPVSDTVSTSKLVDMLTAISPLKPKGVEIRVRHGYIMHGWSLNGVVEVPFTSTATEVYPNLAEYWKSRLAS